MGHGRKRRGGGFVARAIAGPRLGYREQPRRRGILGAVAGVFMVRAINAGHEECFAEVR